MIARKPPLALLLLLAAMLGACTGRGAPEVHHARVVMPPPGMDMAAGYFEIRNPGARALHLRSVSSPVFSSVEMHETVTEGGVSRMRELQSVEIPAGGSVRFEPGGKHLMLMGARPGSAPSEVCPLQLEILDADGGIQRLTADFALESAGGGHQHHDAH